MGKKTSLLNIANDLLKEGHRLRIEAKGYSMYPTIKPGCNVYLDPCSKTDEVTLGDIIAWKQDENVILHRVVQISEIDNNIQYITRGDGSLNYDTPVKFHQILGKATLIESGRRKWVPVSKESIPEWKYHCNKNQVSLISKIRKMIKLLRIG